MSLHVPFNDLRHRFAGAADDYRTAVGAAGESGLIRLSGAWRDWGGTRAGG